VVCKEGQGSGRRDCSHRIADGFRGTRVSAKFVRRNIEGSSSTRTVFISADTFVQRFRPVPVLRSARSDFPPSHGTREAEMFRARRASDMRSEK